LSSPPAAIAGASTLLATLTTDVSKILPGSHPAATLLNMYNAAAYYVQVNPTLVAPPDPGNGYNNSFYAGLWNAVGTACPTGLLAGSFRTAKFKPMPSDAASWSQITVTYTVQANDILFNKDPLFASLQTPFVEQGNASPNGTISVKLAGTVKQFTLTPSVTLAASGAVKYPLEVFKVLYGPPNQATSLIVTAATVPPSGVFQPRSALRAVLHKTIIAAHIGERTVPECDEP